MSEAAIIRRGIVGGIGVLMMGGAAIVLAGAFGEAVGCPTIAINNTGISCSQIRVDGMQAAIQIKLDIRRPAVVKGPKP